MAEVKLGFVGEVRLKRLLHLAFPSGEGGPLAVDEEDTFCTALYLGGYSKRKWRKATSSNDYVVQTGISSSVRHSPATFPAGEGQL